MNIELLRNLFLFLAAVSASAWAVSVAAEEMPDMTFFEYLAEMVETEEGWVDPLELESSMADMDLVDLTAEPAPELEASGKAQEVLND